jgi:hypothetical protein
MRRSRRYSTPPKFRAALENPEFPDLLATPAFQKLLDEAQG